MSMNFVTYRSDYSEQRRFGSRPRAAIEANRPVRPEADSSGVSSSAMPKYQLSSKFPLLFT
jgi:hypothetical protein